MDVYPQADATTWTFSQSRHGIATSGNPPPIYFLFQERPLSLTKLSLGSPLFPAGAGRLFWIQDTLPRRAPIPSSCFKGHIFKHKVEGSEPPTMFTKDRILHRLTFVVTERGIAADQGSR